MVIGFLWTASYVAWAPALQVLAGAVAKQLPAPNAREPGALKTALAAAELKDVQQAAQGRTRVAVAQVAEELELAQDVLSGNKSELGDFFLQWDIAVVRWDEHGAHLAAQPQLAGAHQAARAAYRGIDAVNRSVKRGYETSMGEPLALFDQGRVDLARAAIPPALDALNTTAERD
jgi:hypothetical protein